MAHFASLRDAITGRFGGSVVRLALTARLAPDALRHARRCAPHFFGAVGVVIVVSLTPNTASVATIVGIAVFAAVVVAMSGAAGVHAVDADELRLHGLDETLAADFAPILGNASFLDGAGITYEDLSSEFAAIVAPPASSSDDFLSPPPC